MNDTLRTQIAERVELGVRAAREIDHAVLRSRHLAAWAQRAARVDPAGAVRIAREVDESVRDRGSALAGVVRAVGPDQAREAGLLLALLDSLLQEPDAADPEVRLMLLDAFSEHAIRIAETDRDAARTLLHRLAGEIDPIRSAPEAAQVEALASVLVGDALHGLGDPLGLELLVRAEALSGEVPNRDSLLAFMAQSVLQSDPERAARLAGQLEDRGSRLDLFLQIAGQAGPGPLRERLLADLEPDVAAVEHWYGPDARVRYGLALLGMDPARGREELEEARKGAACGCGQMQAPQLAGLASAVAQHDRDWSRSLFDEALAAARADPHPDQRPALLAFLADAMAETYPREAAELLEEASRSALEMQSLWQFGQFLDTVFRPERSPFLDIQPARPVLELVSGLVSDADSNLPGVLALPEVARWMEELDREAAVPLYQRWFAASREGGDVESMLAAATALYELDPAEGEARILELRDLLAEGSDCPAGSYFCHRVADRRPDLALPVAEGLADPAHRAGALAAVAVGLLATDPERSLAIGGSLPEAADRSEALMMQADRLLQVSFPYPERPLDLQP